jgi:O-antigen/teichoic acid export membrane protein
MNLIGPMSTSPPPICELERGGSSASLLGRIRNLYGLTARKSFVSVIDQIVVSGTSFITTILVGRSGGPEELANYALGFTLVIITFSVLDALIAMPYTIYAIRLEGAALARYRGAVLLQCGLLSVLAAFLFTGWGMVISTSFGPGGLASILYVLSAAIPFYILKEFVKRCALAHLNLKLALQLDLCVGALQITCIAILSYGGLLSALTVFVTAGAANAIPALTWLTLSRNDFVVQRDQIVPVIRQNLSFGGWILLDRLAAQLNTDIFLMWLVAFVLGKKATGVFAACMTVIHLSNPFVLGMGQVLGPRVVKAWTDNGLREMQRVMRKSTIFLGLVLSGFCIGVFLFGEEALRLFYGSQYEGNHHIITMLSFWVLIMVLSLPIACGLFALERPDGNLKANVAGIIITGTVASALVLRFGMMGVVFGLLCGQIGASAVRWLIFTRMVEKTSPLQGLSKNVS